MGNGHSFLSNGQYCVNCGLNALDCINTLCTGTPIQEKTEYDFREEVRKIVREEIENYLGVK